MMTHRLDDVDDDSSLEEQERLAAEYGTDSEASCASDEDSAMFGDKGLPSINSERFLETGQDIRVCSSEGTRTMSRMKALVDLPASEVFAILANPDNSRLIRSINSVRQHQVVSSDTETRQTRAQHDISGGPKIARLEFTLDILFKFFPKANSGEFELESPAGMRIYKGQFCATDVTTSGNRVIAATRSAGTVPSISMDPLECASFHDLPELEKSTETQNVSKQCLLWVQQEIEPEVPQKLPPRTVRGVLRRASRKEMNQFIEDIQIAAQLRKAGVPLDEILSSKIRGRGGLIRKVEGQQKKEEKQLRKIAKQERKEKKRKASKEQVPEPPAPLPPHLAGKSDAGTFRTFAVEV